MKEIFCGVNRKLYSIEQKLSKKFLLELLSKTQQLDIGDAIREQIERFSYVEDEIREILNYMIQQNVEMGSVLATIFLGKSNLSEGFYLDYSNYIDEYCSLWRTKKIAMQVLLKHRGRDLPYEVLYNQKNYIEKETLETYCNYEKFSSWVIARTDTDVSVKISKRRIIFVLNEEMLSA